MPPLDQRFESTEAAPEFGGGTDRPYRAFRRTSAGSARPGTNAVLLGGGPQRRAAASQRPVLIGSPPSAGSTLLSVILDAHPEIACGPELTIFAHPLLYTDFARFRRAVGRGEHRPSPWRDSYRAMARGLAPYSGISEHNARYYGLDAEDVLAGVRSQQSAAGLIDTMFNPWLAGRGKTIFAEKSPVNIYGIPAFVNAFPGGRAICLVRNPLDQILSLKRRSFSFGRALSIWLVETALCLDLAKDRRVHLLRYEDLVRDPAAALDTLCKFLGVATAGDLPNTYRDRSPRIANDPSIALSDWNLYPSDGIQTTAIGRGALELTAEEIAALHGAFIGATPPGLKALAGSRLLDVAGCLGYTLPDCPSVPSEALFDFLAAEMLLADADAVAAPAWWFHERIVKSAPPGEFGLRTAVAAGPRPYPIAPPFRARVLFKVLARQCAAHAKSKTRSITRFVASYLSPHRWLARLWQRFWATVTAEFKKTYQIEFEKAYAAEFTKRQRHWSIEANTRHAPSTNAPHRSQYH